MAAHSGSGHFVSVYSSAVVPTVKPHSDQKLQSDNESIYLSVRSNTSGGGAVKSRYSDMSSTDDITDDTESDEETLKKERKPAENDDDDDEDNDGEEYDDDEEDDDDDDDDDDSYEESYSDSSHTESFSYSTNTNSDCLSEEEEFPADELFGVTRSLVGLKDALYFSGSAGTRARGSPSVPLRSSYSSVVVARPPPQQQPPQQRAEAGGGGNGSSGQSESESDEAVGPYRPARSSSAETTGADGPVGHGRRPAGPGTPESAAAPPKSEYMTMLTSSYVPVDGTTNEAGPQDVPLTMSVGSQSAQQQEKQKVADVKAAAVAYSTQPLQRSDEDASRLSLLEMMDDREIKRRLLFVLSELPLRERSLLLRQLITCSTATPEPWKDLPTERRTALAAAARFGFGSGKPGAAGAAGGAGLSARRGPPPVVQRSASFIHRTSHLIDPHRSDARHHYVSHHASDSGGKATTQQHSIDKDMAQLSLVAREDALREKESRKRRDEEDRKRREEVEAQVLEAFKAATEGKPQPDAATERRLKRDLRKLLMRRRSSGLKKKHLSFDRKWNEEYQALLDKGIWNMSASDAQEVSNLMHDFVFNVETYAKVIINELNVDDSKKTIKPVEVGGIAGGKKYVVQGILFKFCKDPRLSKKPAVWLYGGEKPRDDYAMKAAGLELQGLSLLSTPSLMTTLRHPLMSIIDYKGFRMVAMCLLPLDVTSLRYGSDDGGKTVVASDPTLNKAMEKVGRMFNLKKHTVGRDRVPLIGPGDIEGHLGTDGRYYLLDFARLMPPEAPHSSQDDGYADRSVFYKMLRPELVQQFRVPLSSDAFTGWSKYDTDIIESEREIREATKFMFDEKIPSLARDLDQIDISDFFERVLKEDAQATDVDYLLIRLTKQTNTVYEMHRRGINMRHIGRLRKLVQNKYWRIMLLSEAMSRCIKHHIRYKMRKAVKNSVGVSSESSCKDLVLQHVNVFFGASRESERFWTKKVKRVSAKKYPGLLTAQERKPTFDLRKSLSLRLVFLLTERWNILRLTDRIKREILTKNIHHVRVLPGDVEEVTASVKHFPLIHAIDASLYLMEALNPECEDDEALRLLTSANDHLTAALDEKPRASHMLWTLGRVEAESARRKPFNQDAEQLFEKAIMSHLQALEIEQAPGTYNSLATTMEAFADKLEGRLHQEKERKRRVDIAFAFGGQAPLDESGSGDRLWTDQEIAEKEDKVSTLRRQAAENRSMAARIEEEQPDAAPRVLQFCVEQLSA